MQPRERVSAASATCPKCGGQARPQFVHEVGATSPLADKRLAELGIPAYDIVRLAAGDETKVFLLAGDRRHVLAGES
jgi:hypothetical protein